jgi:hypothetical protein
LAICFLGNSKLNLDNLAFMYIFKFEAAKVRLFHDFIFIILI